MAGLTASELVLAVGLGFVLGGFWGQRLLLQLGALVGWLGFQLYRLWWRWRSWRDGRGL